MASGSVAKMHQLGTSKNLLKLRQLPFKFTRLSSSESYFEQQHKMPIVKKVTPLPMALYGGRHTVTAIPGSGIGPELMNHMKEIFKKLKAPVDFEEIQVNADCDNNIELNYALVSIKRNGVAIKGNIETKCMDLAVALRNVTIRNELDLYVYVFHCKTYPGVKAKHQGIDAVLIRQNTEGEYSMLEHECVPGVVENLKVITRDNSVRVAKYAFEYAREYGRKKVTTVHKANIMKLSDGLFLKTSKDVAKDYPDIKHDNVIIDNCCMQLVANPQQFDIILTTNLYGNIIANVLCGLSGGPGIMSARNYGDHYAVFEPATRGKGAVLAGSDSANPIAMINASVDMLIHLGHLEHAAKLKKALCRTVCVDKIHTKDLGGEYSTTDIVNNIIEYVC